MYEYTRFFLYVSESGDGAPNQRQATCCPACTRTPRSRCAPRRSAFRRQSSSDHSIPAIGGQSISSRMQVTDICLRTPHPYLYTGWPRKNATLTINNFKKTRDRMKKLCPLLRIKFFFQQEDTKIVNFDEGVLILEPFF